MPETQIYIPTNSYNAVVDKLEDIARNFDSAAPDMLRSSLIQVLGEELNIWPEDCLVAQQAVTRCLAARSLDR